MPVRVRPLRFDLLLNPVMAGLQMEVNSSENLGRGILHGLTDIGGGIVRHKQEAESKRRYNEQQAESRRRYDQDFGLRQSEFDLRKERFLESQRDEQANTTALLDLATGASEAAMNEVKAGGQVSDGTKASLDMASNALGGPAAATQKLESRGALALSPSVGEAGVPDLDTASLLTKADEWAAKRNMAKEAADTARSILAKGSLRTEADRAKARLAWNQATTTLLEADKQFSAFSRRAQQAKAREDAAEYDRRQAMRVAAQQASDNAEFQQTSATAMNDPYARAYLGEDPTAEVEKIDAEGNTIGFGTDARRPANLVEAKTALDEASKARQAERVLGRTKVRIDATDARAEADREERRKEAEKRRAFQLSLYERRFSARNAEKELAADEDAVDEFKKYAYQREKGGSFTLRKSIPWTQISPESQKRLMDMARDGNDLLPYEARTAVINAGPSSGAEQDAMRNVPRGTMPEQGAASPEIRSKATAEFKALAPEQQTAEAWAAIKARYKIP